MFFYYFTHSLKNQLIKFVRTWIFLLFLILAFAGTVIWMWASWYYRQLAAANPELPADVSEFFTASGLSARNMLELAVGLFVLAILVIQAVMAEKSVSRLFMQADVNLLFASDRSAQEVLAFRVMNTISLGIAAALILIFRLPAAAVEFGLSPYAAISIFMSWLLLLAFSVLFKILIYEIGSIHPFFHRNLRWFIFAALAVFAVFFYRRFQANEEDLLLTAHQVFNAGWTRWIPVWGWIRGTMFFALEGHMGLSLICFSLCAGLIAFFGFLARCLPADYYEETLNHAQEAAVLAEAVGSESAALLVSSRRHSRSVSRNGFFHGNGSSVYFFRVFHERARLSRHMITKTTVTYLAAALAAGFYVRFFMKDPVDFIPALLLAVIVFFRTIVSPVTEDIRMTVFLLHPEPIWSKLFFSFLGGSVNCALDSAVPLMVGSIAAGFSPFSGLMYLPVLMAVDFFASTSGTFTDVSVPASIGVSFKQVIQVLLIYAGLIFDGVVLAYGITTGHSTFGFVLVTVINLLLGGTFLGLTGVWLYPHHGKNVSSGDDCMDETGARHSYTRIGLALTAMYLVTNLGQVLLLNGFSFYASPGLSLAGLYLPIYGIGLPVFLALMGKAQRQGLEKCRMRVRKLLLFIPVCFFVMYSGNIIGLLLKGVKDALIPLSLGLRVTQASAGHPALQVLLLAVAAPVMEEFVFRRCVMDRLLPYGEKAALVISALLFALFHNVVNQMCYAFLLGLVFGYIYLKTRCMRYTVILHIGINMLSTAVIPILLTWFSRSVYGMDLNRVRLADALSNPGVIGLLIFVTILAALSLLGAVLFFFGIREQDLSGSGIRVKRALSSWGILLFLVVAGVMGIIG